MTVAKQPIPSEIFPSIQQTSFHIDMLSSSGVVPKNMIYLA